MDDQLILGQAPGYVDMLFAERPAGLLACHNPEHTAYVVNAVKKISRYYGLSADNKFVIEIAAWFHDTGYIAKYEDHELKSAANARAFLEKAAIGERSIKEVEALILSTKMPQRPVDLSQQILCDADLYHLGKGSFKKLTENLRQETSLLQKKEIPEKEWLLRTVKFLEDHTYHTKYARLKQDDGKKKNLKKLRTRLKQLERQELVFLQNTAGELEDDLSKDKFRPERGVETMFRTTSSNNQRLSDMADNKAHILITVNSIILSAIISLLLRKLDQYDYLTFPTFFLILVSAVAMTYAILATRPSIPDGTFTEEDVDTQQVNLLFFGNFYKMPLENYLAGMVRVMGDQDFLYHTLIRDVYGQGVVLGKKYRFLRIAYNIFMFGLILSVIAFLLVTIFHQPVLPSRTIVHPMIDTSAHPAASIHHIVEPTPH